MTTFQDGPAKGTTLMLQRAPVYMRVVKNGKGGFDALDMLHDRPEEGEAIFAYVILRKPGHAFIDRTNPRTHRREGFSATVAEYRMVESQPDDATMRDGEAWAAWTERAGMPKHLK